MYELVPGFTFSWPLCFGPNWDLRSGPLVVPHTAGYVPGIGWLSACGDRERSRAAWGFSRAGHVLEGGCWFGESWQKERRGCSSRQEVPGAASKQRRSAARLSLGVGDWRISCSTGWSTGRRRSQWPEPHWSWPKELHLVQIGRLHEWQPNKVELEGRRGSLDRKEVRGRLKAALPIGSGWQQPFEFWLYLCGSVGR